MHHQPLISERELRNYILNFIEKIETIRKTADEKSAPISYFRLTENPAEVVVVTLHLSVLNKELHQDVPDAALPSTYDSVHIATEALQAFKNKWKEAQLEEEVIPRPGMTTYYVSSFNNLAKL